MLGIKMKSDSRAFYAHLRDNHQLLTVAAGDNTLRVLPPLVIGDAEIDEFFEKLSAGAASYTPPVACWPRCATSSILLMLEEIGRASCGARWCQYVYVWVGAVMLKKNNISQ